MLDKFLTAVPFLGIDSSSTYLTIIGSICFVILIIILILKKKNKF